MRFYLLLILTAVCVLGPRAAAAQDDPKVGVTMGYPGAVGVLWQATERIGLRPEFTVSRASSESVSASDQSLGIGASASPSDMWQTGVGLSALIYLTRVESLRTYVSPRFTYSQTSTSSAVNGGPLSTASDSWSYSTSGSFGAQYALGRHFGVFGEAGVSYTSTTSRLSSIETLTVGINIPGASGGRTTTFAVRSDSHAHTIGARSGAGVVFFF